MGEARRAGLRGGARVVGKWLGPGGEGAGAGEARRAGLLGGGLGAKGLLRRRAAVRMRPRGAVRPERNARGRLRVAVAIRQG